MNVSIAFRHPQEWDRVAHVERTDHAGRMAQAVIRIAKELRHSDKYASVYADFGAWKERYNANLNDWTKATNERAELDRIIRYYEPRTYTVKELDELTDEELKAINDYEAEILPSYLQERRKR